MTRPCTLNLSPEDVDLLHGILDSADRWIDEFAQWCNPEDFPTDYSADLDRQSLAIMRLRDRLPPSLENE